MSILLFFFIQDYKYIVHKDLIFYIVLLHSSYFVLPPNCIDREGGLPYSFITLKFL